MRAGGQKVRIEIWRNTPAGKTDLNEVIQQPTLWKTVWSDLVMRQGREFYEDANVFSLTNFYFTVRYLAVEGIDASYWLVFRDQIYDIQNLNPDVQKKDNVVIEARVRNVEA